MKRLINNLTLITILFAINSCEKTINDTKDVCTGDCTIIKGKITTRDQKPISGVVLSFTHKTSTVGSIFNAGPIRKIRNAITDKDGNYEMKFHLEDSEVGYAGTGYFNLAVDGKSIDGNRYIVNSDYVLTYTFYTIARRDTIIEMPIYIPEKTFIKVNLKGFKKVAPNDLFEVQSLWPYGFKEEFGPNTYLGGIFGTGSTPYNGYVATSENYAAKVMVASGDTSVIRVNRIKNGQGNLSEEKRILATGNNNIELTFDF